eukprot:4406891-Prymnesium_polylepis.1
MWVGGGRPTNPRWTPPSDADKEISFAPPSHSAPGGGREKSSRLPSCALWLRANRYALLCCAIASGNQ